MNRPRQGGYMNRITHPLSLGAPASPEAILHQNYPLIVSGMDKFAAADVGAAAWQGRVDRVLDFRLRQLSSDAALGEVDASALRERRSGCRERSHEIWQSASYTPGTGGGTISSSL